MGRDPRVDPQVGDLIEREVGRSTIRRRVTKKFNAEVGYSYVNATKDDGCGFGWVFVSTWRRWAKNARVISVAAETEG